jgi:hypothetical protein
LSPSRFFDKLPPVAMISQKSQKLRRFFLFLLRPETTLMGFNRNFRLLARPRDGESGDTGPSFVYLLNRSNGKALCFRPDGKVRLAPHTPHTVSVARWTRAASPDTLQIEVLGAEEFKADHEPLAMKQADVYGCIGVLEVPISASARTSHSLLTLFAAAQHAGSHAPFVAAILRQRRRCNGPNPAGGHRVQGQRQAPRLQPLPHLADRCGWPSAHTHTHCTLHTLWRAKAQLACAGADAVPLAAQHEEGSAHSFYCTYIKQVGDEAGVLGPAAAHPA